MSIRQELHEAMQKAMKDRDAERRRILATVVSSLQNDEKSGKRPHEFDDGETAAFLLAQVRQRRDSADEYNRHGSTDRAVAELREVGVIEEFIPKSAANRQRLQEEIVALRAQVPGREIGRAMRELKGMGDVGDDVTATVKDGVVVFSKRNG